MDIGPNFTENSQRLLCAFIMCLIFCSAYVEIKVHSLISTCRSYFLILIEST